MTKLKSFVGLRLTASSITGGNVKLNQGLIKYESRGCVDTRRLKILIIWLILSVHPSFVPILIEMITEEGPLRYRKQN